MIIKNKALIGLMVTTTACVCGFSLIQNDSVNFAKAEDIIHTVTVDPTHNHLSVDNGDYTIVNEVGTEIQYEMRTFDQTVYWSYAESYMFLNNPTTSDVLYNITFKINGIVSFDIDFEYNVEKQGSLGIAALMYRGNSVYTSGSLRDIHFSDEEGLCTKVMIDIPVKGYTYFVISSIVLKYSESSCRELSKQ